jgi:hypothetical protein
MVRDNRHDRAYLFGAICPVRAAIIAPTASTECMNLHLQEISAQVTPGAIAALLYDRARWHQPGRELEVPDNIVLLPFPAYSPELRANKLFARVWDSYEAIMEACADAWKWFVDDQTASVRSAQGTGQRSMFEAAGIMRRVRRDAGDRPRREVDMTTAPPLRRRATSRPPARPVARSRASPAGHR